jgi:PIN domain nuclease of toxin-antitoxin system
VRLLVDTHAFLWFAAGDAQLSARARRRIEAPDNERWLSVASIWEIAIKTSLGKLQLDVGVDALVQRGAVENGFQLLEVRRDHAAAVATLPFHPRDPFDRVLVCQAQLESLTMVSRDEVLDAYGVKRVW